MRINGVESNPFAFQKATEASNNFLDKDAFLKILVAQMRYQDPAGPMDSTAYISQLTQMSLFEQMQNVGHSLDELVRVQSFYQAMNFIDREVTVITDGGDRIKGDVERVGFENENVRVMVKGVWYPAEEVVEIGI